MKNKNISRYGLNMVLSIFLFYVLISLVLSSFFSCRFYNLEKKLAPVNSEFLSKVRYIITKKEKKVFLLLAESERENFKEEFWKKRDPDPYTEENEFKMEYFNRMERANEIFLGEGRPGWLTDRGRIYILFGPPMDRMTYSMGGSYSESPYEIWYYGAFPVVFIDATSTGTFRLETYNLSSIRSFNLNYMHSLSKFQSESQKTMREEKKSFQFKLMVEKTFISRDKAEGKVVIQIPYSALWFRSVGQRLESTLDIDLQLKNSQGNLVWKDQKVYQIETDEEELKKTTKKNYEIKIPFIIEENVPLLYQGKNLLFATIKNRTGETGEEEFRKVVEFKI